MIDSKQTHRRRGSPFQDEVGRKCTNNVTRQCQREGREVCIVA